MLNRFNVLNDPVNLVDPLGLKILVCNRPAGGTIGKLGGWHAYLWDTTANEGQGAGYGMQGSSSVWDDHRPEKGPSVDACAEVENSAGKEDEIMDFLRENADNGLWVPRFNDCHNATQDAVESQGLVYPGAPGGRLGRFSGIGGGW